MRSLFRCTVCGAPLVREEKTCRCPNGHCFDIAKEGYTYLLPVNQRHSKAPGDDKAMTAARSAFLKKGYYGFLQRALCQLAVRYTPEAPAVLDVGCGEGTIPLPSMRRCPARGRSPAWRASTSPRIWPGGRQSR